MSNPLKQHKPQPDYRNIPAPFPPVWAVAYGQDNQGLWADFSVGHVLQRMRWIPAGWFLMGSLANEQQRYDDETSHEVTLTQGYWLADTACTQQLWSEITGDNPAHFKEDNQNPIEQVSWTDIQNFLEKLNTLIPELQAELPSEAQWEYACRAGTRTPFSFGENITPEQVNYNGKYPYVDGKKGEYRAKTVAVKAFPSNPWGLYQMHGNIWEWCQDWYGSYSLEPVQDPKGKQEGEDRVLRGGSWIRYGQYVRSAHRYWNTPGYRSDFIGFRFSLGQADEAVAENQASGT